MTTQAFAIRLSPLLLDAARRGEKATSITRLGRAADLTDEDIITGTDGGFPAVWDELARLVPEVELLSTPYRDAGDTREIRLRPTAPAPSIQLSRPIPRLRPYEHARALQALADLWEGRPDAPTSTVTSRVNLRTLCAELTMEAPADLGAAFNELGYGLGPDHRLHGRPVSLSETLPDGSIRMSGDIAMRIEYAPGHVVAEAPTLAAPEAPSIAPALAAALRT